MLKAIWKQGTVQLVDPQLPKWREGLELSVEPIGFDEVESTPEEIDARFDELDRLCAENDPADDDARQRAITEHRQEQKELMRKRMGLA